MCNVCFLISTHTFSRLFLSFSPSSHAAENACDNDLDDCQTERLHVQEDCGAPARIGAADREERRRGAAADGLRARRVHSRGARLDERNGKGKHTFDGTAPRRLSISS